MDIAPVWLRQMAVIRLAITSGYTRCCCTLPFQGIDAKMSHCCNINRHLSRATYLKILAIQGLFFENQVFDLALCGKCANLTNLLSRRKIRLKAVKINRKFNEKKIQHRSSIMQHLWSFFLILFFCWSACLG